MGEKKEANTKKQAIMGLIGVVLFMLSDLFQLFTGSLESHRTGSMALVDTAWADMASWRFPLSIALAIVATPLVLLGFAAVKRQIALTRPKRAGVIYGLGFLITIGNLLSQGIFAMQPVLYQAFAVDGQASLAVKSADLIGYTYYPIYIVLYGASFLLLPIIYGFGILRKRTIYPRYFCLFTSMLLLPLGTLLGNIAPGAFEWLGIAAPNLGFLCMFLFALVYANKEKAQQPAAQLQFQETAPEESAAQAEQKETVKA